MSDILVKIGADITDFSRKMAESQRKLTEFSQANQATFDSFKKVGASITAAGVGIATGLGATVKVASDFQTQMSRVKAISGATEEEFIALNETAKQLGATTVFSASQAGEGMEYLALAGWKTNDIIKAMPGMLDLAAAGALDLGRAADITSDTMSAFGLSAEHATHAADVFAYAQANANTNVEQMGEAMNYLAPTANSLGWSLEEASAVIMELANNGLKGSMATQAFGSSLVRLASPTPKAAKLIKELGMEFFDAEGNMKSMPEVLAEMEKGLEGMNEQQKAAAMDVLVGKNAFKQWQILLEAGSGSLAEMTENLENADGTAAAMAETMLDNLGGAIIMLKSALEGAAITIGETLIPYIKQFTEWLNKLVNWFNELNPKTQQFIAIGSAIAGIFALIAGPLLMLIGFIPQIIIGFQSLGTVLAALSGPIGWIILAIVGIGVALVTAYNKVEWFRDMVNEAWANIKDAFFTAISWIKDNVVIPIMTEVSKFMSEILGKIRAFWDENGEAIMKLVNFYFENIKIYIDTVMKVISAVIGNAWTIISNVTKVLWGIIKTVVRIGIDGVLGAIQFVMKILQGDWEGAWNTIKETVTKIWDNIKKFFEDVDLYQVGKDIIQGLINGIGSMATAVWDAAKKIASNVKDSIMSFLGVHSPARELITIGKYTGEGFAIGISNMVGAVRKASDKLADAAIVEPKQISMDYATPSGTYASLASAVSGTVDVNAREDMIASAIGRLEAKLENLRIELDGREFGRAVSDVSSNERNSAVRSGGRRRI